MISSTPIFDRLILETSAAICSRDTPNGGAFPITNECHPEAGITVSYTAGSDCITLACRQCQKPFLKILVGTMPEPAP